jgi:hypothetical protein
MPITGRVSVLRAFAFFAIVWTSGCYDYDDAGSSSVTLTGQITEFDPDSQGPRAPLADVEICQFASFNCAFTNANGEYTLELLQNRNVELSIVKKGFGSVLIARFSGTEDLTGDAILATDAVLSDLASEIGAVYPPESSGSLAIVTFQGAIADRNPLAGVSYALLGSNGRSFYVNDAGVLETSLTETQALGAGGFVELAPVIVTLQLSGAGVNCTSERPWSAAASNAFMLPIRVGFTTQCAISCE